METEEYEAPAIWASALINLDYSGLEPSDRAALNNWLLERGLSFVDCLCCSDVFTGVFNGPLTELVTYTFPKQK